MKHLKKRILEISKIEKLSHIGSCLSVLPILVAIYSDKKPGDKVFLSGAHSHLAHLVVREHFEGLKNIEKLIKLDIHCNKASGCEMNGGSLAHSGIALGIAVARPEIVVHLIMTDGSLMEGEEWEVMRIKEDWGVKNLKIYCNLNGYTAVSKIDRNKLASRVRAFCPDARIIFTSNGKNFRGVAGHYKTIE